MKKAYLLGIFIVIIILAVVLILLMGKKDGEEQDLQQQEMINCALEKFSEFKNTGAEIDSQCLGVCNGQYAVDIVHVPRTAEDNLPENQCEEYREGKVSHFIELDENGGVVRTV